MTTAKKAAKKTTKSQPTNACTGRRFGRRSGRADSRVAHALDPDSVGERAHRGAGDRVLAFSRHDREDSSFVAIPVSRSARM